MLALDEQTQAVVTQAVSIGTELAEAETELNLARLDYAPNSAYLRALEKRADLLRNQYARIQEGGLTSDEGFAIALSDVPRIAREYATLMRERKIIEQVIMYLETQRHQEAIQEEKDVPIVEVLDKAIPPDFRSAPNRKLMVILTFILTLFLSITMLLAWAFIRGRVYLRRM
ncbi:MAG: GNVR domain-containing protein [Bacteroidota bacterium]